MLCGERWSGRELTQAVASTHLRASWLRLPINASTLPLCTRLARALSVAFNVVQLALLAATRKILGDITRRHLMTMHGNSTIQPYFGTRVAPCLTIFDDRAVFDRA